MPSSLPPVLDLSHLFFFHFPTKKPLKKSGGFFKTPKSRNGRTAVFVPLNRYRATQPDQSLLDPQAWLEQEWPKLQSPDIDEIPTFDSLFRKGRLCLLLDGLNEMPHQDKADYRERIGRWRQFLQETDALGNKIVFSCRSLDYSAPLGSGAVPVRQIRVEPLTTTQMKTFLTLYLAEQGDAIWEALRKNEQQVRLFSNPFFLSLLVEQIEDSGQIPDGQAALLTGFVRRTLQREVVAQEHRFFQPDHLLSEDDYQQVVQNIWSSPYDLPWEGALITQLAKLAYSMQSNLETEEAGQVRVLEKTARELLNHPQGADIILAGCS